MSFPRINPAGYGVGGKVLSSSFNQLDIDHSKSTSDPQYFGGSAGAFDPSLSWGGITGGLAGPYGGIWNDTSIATDTVNGQRFLTTGFLANQQYVLSMTGNDSGVVTVGGAPISIGSTNAPSSLAVDSSGNIYVGFVSGSSVQAYKSTAPNGVFAAFGSGGAATVTDAQIAAFGSIIVGAMGSNTSGAATLGLITGGSWSATVVPAGVISSWILRQNGSLFVALPKIVGASLNVYTSANGSSWVTTSLASTLGATDVPIDVAWSSYLQTWLMAVSVSGGAHTSFYTSTNGTAWTATGTTLNTATVNSIAAWGTVWAALAATTSTSTRTVIHSPDGVSWYGTDTYLYGNSSALIGRLMAAPNMLGALLCPPIATTTSAAYSLRFSRAATIADVLLT